MDRPEMNKAGCVAGKSLVMQCNVLFFDCKNQIHTYPYIVVYHVHLLLMICHIHLAVPWMHLNAQSCAMPTLSALGFLFKSSNAAPALDQFRHLLLYNA